MYDVDAVDEYLSREYPVNEEVEFEEFQEATEVLSEAAYRKSAEWEAAVRQERDVGEVDDIAREAAVIANQLDKVVSSYTHQVSYDEMNEDEEEIFTENTHANTFIYNLGTQQKHLMNPGDAKSGDFALVNGAPRFRPEPEEIEETYTLPRDFISELSPTDMWIDSVEIKDGEDLDRIDTDGNMIIED